MDIPKQVNTTSFRKHIVNTRRTNLTENYVKITWTHPSKGEIEEIVCSRHEQEILKAVHTLGMGCSGEWAKGICLRCQHGDQDIRFWMDIWV